MIPGIGRFNFPPSMLAWDVVVLIGYVLLNFGISLALQITLFFVAIELFTDFHNEGAHASSIRYLLFGLDGHAAMQPWIWAALSLLLIAVAILMIQPLSQS